MHVVMPDELDHERLLANITKIKNHQKNWYERGIGITTAYYYLILGDMELGDPGSRYICIVHNQNFARYAMRDVAELAASWFGQNIVTVNLTQSRLTFLPTGSVFHFLGFNTFIDRYEWGARGERIVRVFEDAVCPRADQQSKYDAAMTSLYAANPNLDVI